MPSKLASTSLLDRRAASGRDPWFWTGVVVVVMLQIAAIWVLCSLQMQRAQAREAIVHVQRLALQDCMRTLPRATPARCAAPIDTSAPAQPEAFSRTVLGGSASDTSSLR